MDDEWSSNPGDWPHTPPLAVYRKLEADDPNLFWRMASGHAQNLLDEALALAEEQAAAIARVEALADQWETTHPADRGHDSGHINGLCEAAGDVRRAIAQPPKRSRQAHDKETGR